MQLKTIKVSHPDPMMPFRIVLYNKGNRSTVYFGTWSDLVKFVRRSDNLFDVIVSVVHSDMEN